MPTPDINDLLETPLALKVWEMQDQGHDLYIAGFSPDGQYALIVVTETDSVSVGHVHTVNGLGRWECTKAHYQHHTDLYHQRFPIRA